MDNIPGVEGIGPKTATKLITEHGSLAALMGDLSVVKNEKLRAKLDAARSQIEANREMVRLDTHHELPQAIEELVVQPRYAELIAALEACEFKGLLAEVKADAAKSGVVPMTTAAAQGELF